MKRLYDVAALGELLIDFAPGGLSPNGRPLFECNPGGAPANVLAALARLGKKTAFLGKVGEDAFGHMLADTLRDCGIDRAGLRFDREARTTLAFVSLDDSGNRSFSFFRNPGADIMLRPEEIDPALICASRLFHFGSLSLTHEPVRSATRFALEIARENGLLVSYDPNLRPLLWPSPEEARAHIIAHLPYADIVKISEEEFTFLTGHRDFECGTGELAREYGIACLFVTLGSGGALYRRGSLYGAMPTYDVQVVDTTGSGDAFMGAVLSRLCGLSREELEAAEEGFLREAVDFANAAGSVTATKKGGIPAIPTAAQIEECMAKVPKLAASGRLNLK